SMTQVRFDIDNRENTKALKPRRRLPTPTPSPKPSSPTTMVTPVPPTNFYASHQNTPTLPSRSKNVGSSHTTYLAPPTPPPNYDSHDSYREPELITEEPIPTDEPVPGLVPQYQDGWYGSHWSDPATWNTPTQTTSNEWVSNTDPKWSSASELDYWNSSYTSRIPIDGRDEQEETRWWDPAVRDKYNRPGAGILPPILGEFL